jgi:hypothetical protein
MTRRDHLLIKLLQELNELSQAVTKCMLFTPEHVYPKYKKSNLELAAEEYLDVKVVISMLAEEGFHLSYDNDKIAFMANKIQRNEHYMRIAKELGTLDE